MNKSKSTERMKRICYTALGLLLIPHSVLFAQPVTLEESIQMALRNNPAIQLAEKDRQKSELGMTIAQGAAQPSVSLTGSGSWNKMSDTPASSGSSASLGMSLTLYDGNKTQNRINEAKQTLDSSVLSVEKSRQDVILDVISAYYTILANRNTLQVNQETADNYKKHLETVQAMYQNGVVPKSDVLSSEVQFANARQNVIKAKNTYDVSINNYKNIVKLQTNEQLEFIDDYKKPDFSKTLPACIAFALDNQPDIRIGKIDIDKAQTELEIAKGDKRPAVSLSASTGWNDSLLPKDNNYNVGVSASWNVFDGQVTDAKIKQAGINLEQAKLQLSQKVDSITSSVQEYYLNMKEAEERLNSTQTAVSQATENYFIAHEKYKAGEGIMLDIIDAQLSLTQAKVNYIQAQYDYAVNKAKLANSMGINSLNKGDF